MKWLLAKVGLIVLIGIIIDIALLYWQAREGRRLPWKIKLIPTFDVGGQFS